MINEDWWMSDLWQWSICTMKLAEMDTSCISIWPQSEMSALRTQCKLGPGEAEKTERTFQNRGSILRYPAMQGLNLALFFLILDLSVSYFPFSEIFLLQNIRAQIWFLGPHEYCSHWLFHTYLALIQKEFGACRIISHLEDKVSNWRSVDLQHLVGTGGETFGCVVPIATAEPSRCRFCLSMQSTQSLPLG